MGENMRPSGATPPSSSLIYPQVFPSNNTHDPHHHQYGAFSSGFTAAAAAACSSSGYPTFFPS